MYHRIWADPTTHSYGVAFNNCDVWANEYRERKKEIEQRDRKKDIKEEKEKFLPKKALREPGLEPVYPRSEGERPIHSAIQAR